jgi:hypothetical protein
MKLAALVTAQSVQKSFCWAENRGTDLYCRFCRQSFLGSKPVQHIWAANLCSKGCVRAITE